MRRVALLALLAACYPTTTRPDLQPLPEAPRLEIELFMVEATPAPTAAPLTAALPVALS